MVGNPFSDALRLTRRSVGTTAFTIGRSVIRPATNHLCGDRWHEGSGAPAADADSFADGPQHQLAENAVLNLCILSANVPGDQPFFDITKQIRTPKALNFGGRSRHAARETPATALVVRADRCLKRLESRQGTPFFS